MPADTDFAASVRAARSRLDVALDGPRLHVTMLALAASHHAHAVRHDTDLAEALALPLDIAASFERLADPTTLDEPSDETTKSLAADLFGGQAPKERATAIEFLPSDDGIAIVEQGASPC